MPPTTRTEFLGTSRCPSTEAVACGCTALSRGKFLPANADRWRGQGEVIHRHIQMAGIVVIVPANADKWHGQGGVFYKHRQMAGIGMVHCLCRDNCVAGCLNYRCEKLIWCSSAGAHIFVEAPVPGPCCGMMMYVVYRGFSGSTSIVVHHWASI